MRELLGKVLREYFDQFVRVRLSEHEPVVDASSSDGGPALLVTAEGQYWDVALEVDFALAAGDPFRVEAVVVGWRALVAEAEEFDPWLRVTERFDAVVAGEAAADGVTLVALDPSFPLLGQRPRPGLVPARLAAGRPESECSRNGSITNQPRRVARNQKGKAPLHAGLL
jgi:hypothetical protein